MNCLFDLIIYLLEDTLSVYRWFMPLRVFVRRFLFQDINLSVSLSSILTFLCQVIHIVIFGEERLHRISFEMKN